MLKKINFMKILKRAKWTIERIPPGIVIAKMNTNDLNTINEQFCNDFHDCVDEVEKDYPHLPLVITSELTNGFFSDGMDKEWLKELLVDGKNVIKQMNDLFERLYLLERPVIGAVNGNAHGGGFILSLCCDFRFIDPQFSVKTRAPGLGMAYPSSVYHIVKYEIPFYKKFLLTGDEISGNRAVRERISLTHRRGPLNDALDFIENDIISVDAFVANKVSLKHNYFLYQEIEGKIIDEKFLESLKLDKTQDLIKRFVEDEL